MSTANEALRNDVDSAVDSIKRADWRIASVDEQAEQLGSAMRTLRGLADELTEIDARLSEHHRHHTLQLTEVVKGVTEVHGTVGQLHTHSRRFGELFTEVGAIAVGLEAETGGLELSADKPEPAVAIETAPDEGSTESEIVVETNIRALNPRRV